ncbi:MAG: hypothetical protein ACR2QQ_14815 [Gammaproteobacteria bacterium]
MSEQSESELEKRIDAIESAYEFMLAYAAQGRDSDAGTGAGASELRSYLDAMNSALDGLGDAIGNIANEKNSTAAQNAAAFLQAIDEDALRARGILQLVLAQDGISSQLIDNVNGSIHLRALLTDLFVIDEALKN